VTIYYICKYDMLLIEKNSEMKEREFKLLDTMNIVLETSLWK